MWCTSSSRRLTNTESTGKKAVSRSRDQALIHLQARGSGTWTRDWCNWLMARRERKLIDMRVGWNEFGSEWRKRRWSERQKWGTRSDDHKKKKKKKSGGKNTTNSVRFINKSLPHVTCCRLLVFEVEWKAFVWRKTTTYCIQYTVYYLLLSVYSFESPFLFCIPPHTDCLCITYSHLSIHYLPTLFPDSTLETCLKHSLSTFWQQLTCCWRKRSVLETVVPCLSPCPPAAPLVSHIMAEIEVQEVEIEAIPIQIKEEVYCEGTDWHPVTACDDISLLFFFLCCCCGVCVALWHQMRTVWIRTTIWTASRWYHWTRMRSS